MRDGGSPMPNFSEMHRAKTTNLKASGLQEFHDFNSKQRKSVKRSCSFVRKGNATSGCANLAAPLRVLISFTISFMASGSDLQSLLAKLCEFGKSLDLVAGAIADPADMDSYKEIIRSVHRASHLVTDLALIETSFGPLQESHRQLNTDIQAATQEKADLSQCLQKLQQEKKQEED